MARAADELPVIDVTSLVRGEEARHDVAARIDAACRDVGFFYVVGHGVPRELREALFAESRRFFVRPEAEKARIAMTRGGRAWRGWFPVGGELTSGRPDRKEGVYFGAELHADHPLVRAGTPLHGANLFPDDMPAFRGAVLHWMDAMTTLGQALLRGMALALGLPEAALVERFTTTPLTLFRIFNYPAPPPGDDGWGVGEHTDYGFLTILAQDDAGGLEVRTRDGWIAAPPLSDAFVCNIGDMLDRVTRGLYRSTPHRVRNPSRRDRLSLPFFFDPGWDARIGPLVDASRAPADDRAQRWDGASVHDFDGTYGDYVLRKVARVFPDLHRDVL
ncbi:isopenicillin N synthase family oxygenase [Candidatus Binatia bacterium]|nr:isopenicillin N synthase family oxygenase [Candidatus Binatia bacterium]